MPGRDGHLHSVLMGSSCSIGVPGRCLHRAHLRHDRIVMARRCAGSGGIDPPSDRRRERSLLGPYHVVGLALKGEHSVMLGQLEKRIELLHSATAVLRTKRDNVLMRHFEGVLGRALTRAQQFREASAVVENALATSIEAGEPMSFRTCCAPRENCSWRAATSIPVKRKKVSLKAIQYAELQAAPSAKLRAAIPLASHWLATGRRSEAHDLLTSIYSEFMEGFGTVDLRGAAHLLAEIKQDCENRQLSAMSSSDTKIEYELSRLPCMIGRLSAPTLSRIAVDFCPDAYAFAESPGTTAPNFSTALAFRH